MDCLEFMKTLPDKCIDLVLTDPPYGLNSKMKGGTWGINTIYKEMLVWDNVMGSEYFNEIFRVSKNQIIWGGNYYSMPPSRCWLAWEKTEKMDTLADFELAWTSFDKLSKLYKERRNPDGKREHPTQKPISLMAWCLKKFSKDGDTILDPFAGGGSTLMAAKMLNRNYIGCEISPEYCKIAEDRIKSISNTLF